MRKNRIVDKLTNCQRQNDFSGVIVNRTTFFRFNLQISGKCHQGKFSRSGSGEQLKEKYKYMNLIVGAK